MASYEDTFADVDGVPTAKSSLQTVTELCREILSLYTGKQSSGRASE